MTREEQTICAANNLYCPSGISNKVDINNINTFICGAQWADNNPYWHKYPDEKPKERGRYLVLFREENHMYVGEYSTKTEEFFMLEDVKAWMELPKPPKFD